MENKNLAQVETFIKETIEILEKQYEILEQRGYSTQTLNDLMQGQVRLPSDIIVPAKSTECYFLYDHYELTIVQTVIQLQKNIFNERDSPFIAFSLRTLLDIGVNRIDVLFADEITQPDKKRVKLLALLIDFLSTDDPVFTKYFINLFEAEKTNFTKRERQLFEDILTLIKSKNNIELIERIIQARRMLSEVERTIHSKIKPLPFLNKASMRSFYSGQSHMLHGNPFLIRNVFDKQNKEEGKLTLFAILMITGLNALTRLANYLNDPKITSEVQNKNKEIKTLWTVLNFYKEKLWGKSNLTS